MSNLEHLLENGLMTLKTLQNKEEWKDKMRSDVNWRGPVYLTLDELWEICQYVVYTWDIINCEDCKDKEQ